MSFALLLLSACHRTTPQEQASKDAHAIAVVEKARQQRPPLEQVQPEPVSFAELSRPDATVRLPADVKPPKPGEGCTLTIHGTPMFVAIPQFGLTRFAGRLEMFAADSGSAELKGGLHRTYAGSEHTLELVPPASGKGNWQLIVRDRFDRIAFTEAGQLDCGAS